MALVLCSCLLFGCSGNSETEGDHSAPVTELAGQILSADTTLPQMVTDTSEDENAKINFEGFLTADYDCIVGYSRSYAAEGTADEIVVICVASEKDVASVKKALQTYEENRRGTMEAYMPEEVEKIDNAVLTSTGCYIGLFISGKSGLDKTTFKEGLAAYGIQ